MSDAWDFLVRKGALHETKIAPTDTPPLAAGQVLAAVDRLRVEIAAAAREVEPPTQPEPSIARQVRRWVDSMDAATARLPD